jgi:Lysyl oxidase
MYSKSRLVMFTLLLGLAVLAPASASAADILPDLGMRKLQNLTIENTTDGRRLLRFTAIIVNAGVGPFEVRGQRPDTTNPDMTVRHRIYNDQGGFRSKATSAVMYYAGDGHNHWHLRDLERYELVRLDNGVKVGTGVKRGFCFWDNATFSLTLPDAPQSPVYTDANSCAFDQPNALKSMEGLSIGWGDRYPYKLPDQYIDITGLGAGQYRLLATADADNWFLEGNETNNTTWVDIQLTGSGLTILGYGGYLKP